MEIPANYLLANRQVYGDKTGIGEPVSANPTRPDYAGQMYFDQSAAEWYIATAIAMTGWKLLGGATADVSLTAVDDGNFFTYNLFSGSNGPYWFSSNLWNVGGLTNNGVGGPSSYAFKMTADSAAFPSATTWNWSFPSTFTAGNVYGYPSMMYGIGVPGNFLVNGQPFGTNPTPLRPADFSNLLLHYNMDLNMGANDADWMTETWLSPDAVPTDQSVMQAEISFFNHTPDYLANYVTSNALTFAFNYSGGSPALNAYVAVSAGVHPQISIMPVTAPGGTTPLDMTVGNQTIDFKSILLALVSNAVIDGNNYIVGYDFGPEIGANAGTCTLHGFTWTWN